MWAFEAAERLAYVHTSRGRYEVDLSLTAVESSMRRSLLRVHRNCLVNVDHVRELEGSGNETELLVSSTAPHEECLRVPVSRDRAHAARETLLERTMGLRSR